MERRNRNILVVLIGIVIVVAMLSSFGLGLFAPDTAKIQLPTPGASQSPEPAGDEGYVRVEITPQTVQYVIEQTLSRPESYGRTVTIEDFWGDGQSGVTRATVWVDGGWTRTDAVWPGGTQRSSIVGEGRFWVWYGDGAVLTGPADGSSADLEGQRESLRAELTEIEGRSRQTEADTAAARARAKWIKAAAVVVLPVPPLPLRIKSRFISPLLGSAPAIR